MQFSYSVYEMQNIKFIFFCIFHHSTARSNQLNRCQLVGVKRKGNHSTPQIHTNITRHLWLFLCRVHVISWTGFFSLRLFVSFFCAFSFNIRWCNDNTIINATMIYDNYAKHWIWCTIDDGLCFAVKKNTEPLFTINDSISVAKKIRKNCVSFDSALRLWFERESVSFVRLDVAALFVIHVNRLAFDPHVLMVAFEIFMIAVLFVMSWKCGISL